MSSNTKAEAEILRKSGKFYSEIATELNVAKSTVYGWTHTLVLDDQVKKELAEKLKISKRKQIVKLAESKNRYRVQRESLIRDEAVKTVKNATFSKYQKRVLCSTLFWCEGGKDVTSGIQFINSDPLMVSKFLALLREVFDVKEEKFRALVHLHEYHDRDEILQYWSSLTDIPLSQFHRPYLKPHTGKNKHVGYKGCISIRYLDSSLGNLLKMIYIEFGKSV